MIKFLARNINSLDSTIFLKIFCIKRRKVLDRIMYVFSRFGDGYVYPFIGIIILIFDFNTAKRMVPAGIIAFSIKIPTYEILKKSIKRIRPFEKISEIKNLIRVPDKFSFPSGHTAAAFVMVTIISSFYPEVRIPAYTNAFLIGFSRVYNGVHYPGDVFAGAVLGNVSARIGLSLIL